MDAILIPLIFFVIAVLYSSVGFGGGSSYLAVLNLFSVAFVEMRFIALACNILVVSGSTILYYRDDLIRWQKLLPLLLLSVPLAFVGGRIAVNREVFLLVLGITLLIAGPVMLLQNPGYKTQRTSDSKWFGATTGGLLGLLSGMVGIGGGIFLSPLLHLTRWDRPKVIAAASSVFILVNSIAGLIGQVSNSAFVIDQKLLINCLLAVLIGGQLGVRLSLKKGTPKLIRTLTAILVIYAGARIIFDYYT